jgi:stearoyl-CoA desaturase (delta-9 desaturase)
VLGIYCLFGTPIGIAATHVLHHRHADTGADPHPAREGWRAWCWTYSGMQTRDRATVVRLSADPWLRVISKHYFQIYFSTVFLAGAVDPRLVCHRWGYRRYTTPDQSRNNLIVNVALFFGGIALHNTHHANPKACFLSRAWYEIDLVGCMANVIHRHNLANKKS